jgi:hypothetical protein
MFPPLGLSHGSTGAHGLGGGLGGGGEGGGEGGGVGGGDGGGKSGGGEAGGGRAVHIPTTDVLRSTELPPATKHPWIAPQ